MTSGNNKLVVANFKMYLATKTEIDQWLSVFSKAKKGVGLQGTKIVLCPSNLFLEGMMEKNKNNFIGFGTQDIFWENKGAYTGQVSPTMAHSVGADYVIVGHSERRIHLGETDEVIAKKIQAATNWGMRPILCVGENAQQKKRDMLMDVVLSQLRKCLAPVTKGKIEKIIICYEPVWAISANKPDHLPTVNEIMGAKLLIRKFLVEKYGKNVAQRVRIIYGGSVDSKNIKNVCIDPGMDGVLVGKASTLPYELIRISQQIEVNQ